MVINNRQQNHANVKHLIGVWRCMAQNKNKAISATHLKHRNQGVGNYLLAHALVTIRQAAALIGIGVIVVDAKNIVVAEFYKKFSFVGLNPTPQGFIYW